MLSTAFGGHSSSQYSASFFDLIKSIGESSSKQEQDKIISSERTRLKSELTGCTKSSQFSVSSSGRSHSKNAKEWVLRALYCEMFGTDASFAFIQGINLAQDNKNLMAKRTGYLFCGLSFVPRCEANLLLVNTLLKDLESSNWLFNVAALVAICSLPSVEIASEVSPWVVKLCSHQESSVRRRAFLAMQTLMRVTTVDLPPVLDVLAQALSDPDAVVMSSCLPLIEVILQDDRCALWAWDEKSEGGPGRVFAEDLAQFFVTLIGKIAIDRELPRCHEYYRCPAPWIQARIISILTMLGLRFSDSLPQIHGVLEKVLDIMIDHSASQNIGAALLYSVARSLCQLYDFSQTTKINAVVVRFISSSSPELRHAGLNLLTDLIKLDESIAKSHSMAVVEFLEDHDEQIQRAALNLITEVTTSANLDYVLDRLTSAMNFSYDRAYRRQLCVIALTLLSSHALDGKTFIDRSLEVLMSCV
eukprot:GHVH01006476.1.p1 GENE.GHVH01006476.1~~GHVH01006476.1.p1  ORF type:complete len:474 (+),score=61.52 GHVH01006476.1:38-1459(+)